jgi:hypothetical protein
MRRAWRSWALALAAAGIFLWGAISLFNRQFASGELYPDFSSMRTDRLGTRLLYDSLARLEGITVERNYLPVEFLQRDGATVLMLGTSPLKVNWDPSLLMQVQRMASRGNRVVVALYLDPTAAQPRQDEFDHPEEPKEAKGKSKSASQPPTLKMLWKVTLRIEAGERIPHPLYFGETEGWRVRDKVGTKILAIERDFDKGSVVLMTESGDFSNESMVAADRLRQVSGAIGPYRRIVFDEQHLGIAESGSVVQMAKQFRLMGLAIGLGLVAALFLWRSAAGFPPPAAARPVERFSGRTSHAGLLTLLKRHIPAGELAAVCWREWLATNRREVTPERQAQAEAILAGAAGRPVEATRELQALLHAKGEL